MGRRSSRATRALRAFRTKPPAERRLLVGATVLLLAAETLLRVPFVDVRGVTRMVRVLTGVLFAGAPATDPDAVVWALDAVAPFLPDSVTCLRRAVVADSMLDHAGHDTEMHIGVRKTDAAFEAHAWVEHEGRVLVGELDDLAAYSVLPLEEAGL